MGSSTPKHRGGDGHAYTARRGRFVVVGSTGADVVLVDTDGNTWPLQQVSILGGLGSRDDGAVKLPRPWRFDARGAALVEGDDVWVDFDRASPKRPVVVGIVRTIRASAFLPERHDVPGADPNRLAARLQPLDSNGAPVGVIELEAGHGGAAGVRLSADGGVRVEVGDVVVRVTADGVEVTRGGAPSRVHLAEPFQAHLQAWVSVIEAFVAASATAVTAAQIAGYAVTATTALEQLPLVGQLALNGYSSSLTSSE